MPHPNGRRPRIHRDAHGVPHVQGRDQAKLCYGLGWCHARDRGMQLVVTRLVAQGRTCEGLGPSDELLAVDRFFRRLGLAVGAAEQVEQLAPRHKQLGQASGEGVNARLMRHFPWELRLAGTSKEPWQPPDLVLMARLVAFVGMAESQADMEAWLCECLWAGVSPALLQELFPTGLQGLDVDWLRTVTPTRRIVPDAVRFGRMIPRVMASNNWVISGFRTRSGAALLSNDPHLDAQRLPALWYETVFQWPGGYCIAGTMPGFPAALVGRSRDLAWGATYSFADTVDSWVEECEGGSCLRLSPAGQRRWEAPIRRTETILRRKLPPVTCDFFENEHGILDGDPRVAGRYLATRWAGGRDTGAATLAALLDLQVASTVQEGQRLVGQVEPSFNFVLADRAGDIAYQMSGRIPRRREGASGLVPLAGWDAGNDWQGWVDPVELPRLSNPACGYIATANQDLNDLGNVRPINLPMADWRARRIEQLLSARSDWDAAGSLALQLDLYSEHADTHLKILRPVLPQTDAGRLLAAWDCRYTTDSIAASHFERFYRELFVEVFSVELGRDVVEHVLCETRLFANFYGSFDRVLLNPDSGWYQGRSQVDVFRQVAQRVLAQSAPPWGEANALRMPHLLFGGKLPGWLGFDQGPVPLPGGRATVYQHQQYRAGGRATSFLPSYRLITDMAQDSAHTALAGGPSDRRFSRWYKAGLDDWAAGRVKELAPL